jgi:hypothetical protein
MNIQEQVGTDANRVWRGIYLLGGIATSIVLLGVILDIIVGSVTGGGNLTALPQTAIDKFAELQKNCLFGLYGMDLLNVINQIILIPAYFALYTAHSKYKNGFAALALIVFLVGTTLFVANNTALTMLDLSSKYTAATTDAQKSLIAAGGEAMLAKGSHGSMSAFVGFLLPNIAGIIMSFVMLTGNVFGKATSWFGIIGSIMIIIYLVLVTFTPGMKSVALAISAPGGILLMVWMVLFTIRLFKMSTMKS